MLEWTEADRGIWIAHTYTLLGRREIPLVLRVDGQGTPGTWRVVAHMPMGVMWEDVDNGDALPSREAAQEYAALWLAAATAQATLSPRVEAPAAP
jgi:hypothetical protein